MAKTIDDKPRKSMGERAAELNGKVQGSQAWNSIFRPGSIFRKGYTDSPRNRSYVIMNSVLYHLHPVSQLAKTLLLSDVREAAGIPAAHKLEMRNERSGSHTTVDLTELKYNAGLDDEVFTQRRLEKGAS